MGSEKDTEQEDAEVALVLSILERNEDSSAQIHLQIECNPHQNTNGIFHWTEACSSKNFYGTTKPWIAEQS